MTVSDGFEINVVTINVYSESLLARFPSYRSGTDQGDQNDKSMLEFAPPGQVADIEGEIVYSSSLEMSEEIEWMLREKFEGFFKGWFSIEVF